MAKTYTPPVNFKQEPDEPILSVSWYEAAQFCRWLSDKEKVADAEMCYPAVAEIKPGLKLDRGFLTRTGYRLPTELEWEYACRGHTRTIREYGSAPALLDRYAWTLGTRDYRPAPVGHKWPTDTGLFDLYGNAWELTQPVTYTTDKAGVREDFWDDPTPMVSGETGDYHPVARGGSFLAHEPLVYSARRYPIVPDHADWTVGFRVARTLPATEDDR